MILNLGLSLSAAGTKLPPVPLELITWLAGSNVSDTLKRDSINQYHFVIQNCPGEVTGWDCEYLAPESGEDGYTELLAIDDGTLYSGGVPNVLDQDILRALNNDQMFFSLIRGLGIYDSVLTGDELTEVQEYFKETWILEDGTWDDTKFWEDLETWRDN